MKRQQWIPSALVIAALVFAAAGCSRSAQSYVERGDAQLKSGNVDAAVLEYRNAIQKDATFAAAHQKLSDAYMRQGNGSGAIGEAIRAADLLPADVEAQLKAGWLLYAAGRPDDARARAEKALAVNPKSADGMTLRASALAGLNDYDVAIAQLRQAIAIEPTGSRRASLGRLLERKGLAEEAERELRGAVAGDPKSVDAHLALAGFLSARKRPAEAEAAFRAALAVDPANAIANSALAEFYIASNRAREAEPLLRALADKGDNVAASLALADYYGSMNRNADARAVLDKLAASPRTWAVARSRTAAILYVEGKSLEAHRTLDEVIAKYPGYAQARVVRGRLLLAEGKTEQALADAQEAVKADPGDADGHFLLGTVQEARQDLRAAAAAFNEVIRLNPTSTPTQVRLAAIDLRLRDLSPAIQLAEQVIERDPANLEAHLILVRGLLERGDVEPAAAAGRTLVQRFPQSGSAQTQAGLLALARGDRAGARAAFERALALDPLLLEPLTNLAALDVNERQGNRARARLEARLQKTPHDSEILALAARVWAATGDTPKGEEFLRRAIDADPANFSAYQMLAAHLISQRRLDEALAQYEKLIAKQPTSTGPQTMAALILEAQGKKAEARQRYERIVQADPRAAVAANNLAWILATGGEQLDRALQLAQAARAEQPNVPAISDTLAYVYIRKELGELAVPLLNQAIARQAEAKEPEQPSHFYHLGLAQVQAGKKAEARRAFEHALKLRPDFEGAEDARRQLAALAAGGK